MKEGEMLNKSNYLILKLVFTGERG